MIIETHLWSFRREKWNFPRGKVVHFEDGGGPVFIAGKYGNPTKRESFANDYSRAARSRRTVEIGSRNEILSSN